MGAAISTAYVLKHQAELAGLVLSGGGITPSDLSARLNRGRDAARTGDLSSTLSRDPKVMRLMSTTRSSTLAPPNRPNALSGMRSSFRPRQGIHAQS
jgi:pimeloyl-ACP methyl ester carboxylesterase